MPPQLHRNLDRPRRSGEHICRDFGWRSLNRARTLTILTLDPAATQRRRDPHWAAFAPGSRPENYMTQTRPPPPRQPGNVPPKLRSVVSFTPNLRAIDARESEMASGGTHRNTSTDAPSRDSFLRPSARIRCPPKAGQPQCTSRVMSTGVLPMRGVRRGPCPTAVGAPGAGLRQSVDRRRRPARRTIRIAAGSARR
jgi:hypothetical protein